MTTISIIVAIDEQNAIGKDNQLLCHLPNDLKYFKTVTQGHSVIMGRNTFLSLPNGALPNRRNIILSRNKDYSPKDCEIVSSLDEALELCRDEKEIFIMGGAMLYKEAIRVADKLYISYIHHSFEDADAFFPQIEESQWTKVSSTDNPADEKNKYSHSFVVYARRGK